MTTDQRSDARTSELAPAAAERMTFFSDAVVAIAMTLLAIELPVPEGGDVGELLGSFGANAHEYLMFAISYAVIAVHWMVHHRVFGWVRRVNGAVVRLNAAWLFLVVVNPFLTKVLADGESNVVRFGLYALAQALMMFTLAAMIVVVARNGWFAEDAPSYLSSRGYLRSVLSGLAFLIAIAAYPAIGQWAFVIFAVVPLTGSRLVARREPAPAG
jgi:uncharacterized membrane protein